jgi:two-component system, chemotaxis family, chemotaxis protein CheY
VRILIVDDSPVIRLILQRDLANYGEVESVQNGHEAIDAFTRRLGEGSPFHLVCLDLGLPDIPGTDVLEGIRALEAKSGSPLKSRVLVITASSESSEVEAARQRGADGYIIKPIDKRKLAEYLESFGLSGASAGTELWEIPVKHVEELCGKDSIPAAVLAQLIQRMADSIYRQHSALPE